MADDKVRIEFVCLANVERSPMACAIGRKWVSEHGLSERIEVYSSGTNVDRRYSFGEDMAVRILRRGSAAEGLDPSVNESIKTLLGTMTDEDVVKQYSDNFILRKALELLARQVLEYLTPDGKNKRNQVLSEHGLGYDDGSHQTVADARTRLILPMTEGLCRRVGAIYNEGKMDVPLPAVHALPDYSRILGIYEGTLGAGIEKFREVFATFERAVPAALEKAVKEFKLC